MSRHANALRDMQHVLPHYTNISKRREDGPAVITHGRRVYVTDESGREYLDGTAGMFAASLGFNEPELVEAAIEQYHKLPYYHYGLYKSHEPSARLAEKLAAMVPIPNARIHYASSGSEAHEFLIKFLWYANHALDKPRKRTILAHANAWHGSTLFAGSMSGIAKCHQGFGLPLPGVIHVTEPNYYRGSRDGESEEEFSTRLVDEVEQVILEQGPETVAAFILEPMSCAAGMVPRPATYHVKLQAMLGKYDVKILADEVVTGIRPHRGDVRVGEVRPCARRDVFRQGPDFRLRAAVGVRAVGGDRCGHRRRQRQGGVLCARHDLFRPSGLVRRRAQSAGHRRVPGYSRSCRAHGSRHAPTPRQVCRPPPRRGYSRPRPDVGHRTRRRPRSRVGRSSTPAPPAISSPPLRKRRA